MRFPPDPEELCWKVAGGARVRVWEGLRVLVPVLVSERGDSQSPSERQLARMRDPTNKRQSLLVSISHLCVGAARLPGAWSTGHRARHIVGAQETGAG